MTIKDLSAKTGYAVGTVSRALNNHPNVSEKARRIILKAAKDSGFELNQNAKQLKQQYTNNILVVVKGIGNELFGEMVETLQNLIAKTRYLLVVDYIDEDQNEVIRAIQLIREKKPQGILFLGGSSRNFTRDFDKIDVPCILITTDASRLHFDNLSSVTIDDSAAAEGAMDTLVALGHRHVAIIGGDVRASDISRLRLDGCLRSFSHHQIDFDPKRDYQSVRFSCEAGYQATKKLLDSGREFTAIFAAADVIAIGAIRALWEAGKRVPQDISVMGVDGLPMGTYLVPQLATVSQGVRRMAIRSVEILLDCIEEGSPACHELVPFTIQNRESIRSILE